MVLLYEDKRDLIHLDGIRNPLHKSSKAITLITSITEVSVIVALL